MYHINMWVFVGYICGRVGLCGICVQIRDASVCVLCVYVAWMCICLRTLATNFVVKDNKGGTTQHSAVPVLACLLFIINA